MSAVHSSKFRGLPKDRVYMNDFATRAEGEKNRIMNDSGTMADGGKDRIYMNDSATRAKEGKGRV